MTRARHAHACAINATWHVLVTRTHARRTRRCCAHAAARAADNPARPNLTLPFSLLPPPSPAAPRRADKNGNTPLHVAARTGFKDVVKLLISAGAKPTSNRAGKTPDQLAEGDLAAMIAALI